jgi:hypothetical protein
MLRRRASDSHFVMEKALILGLELFSVFDSPFARLFALLWQVLLTSVVFFFPISFGWWDVLFRCHVLRLFFVF